MNRQQLNTAALMDPGWWHWTATLPLLVLSIVGYPWACWAAIGLCAFVATYFWLRVQRVRPYPVQVRLAYLGVLVCGMLPGMRWFYWVPLIGTTAMVTVGYCPLLRLLSLAPWNRSGPASFFRVWHAFVSMPCAGGLLKSTTNSSVPASLCCSLHESRLSDACSASRVSPMSSCVVEEDHVHLF